MDGLLIIDKPVGPTSHDVVARMRRVLRERRIGHTGTLDPAASGVLPLVLGRATRLARFLSASDKSYDVAIRLGVATDSGDAEGAAIGGRYAGPMPAADVIDRALEGFRGTFLQQPPALSAKKIGGQRSYALARARQGRDGPEAPPLPAPVSVTAAIEIVSARGDEVTLRVDCSAGFYVRALAHDLGVVLRIGAHVEALRRTRSGDLTLRDAIPLAEAEQHPERAATALIALSRMLPGLPAVVLSTEGVRHAIHGRNIGPADLDATARQAQRGSVLASGGGAVRLMDAAGELVGIAEPARASGLLHPAVVLM